MCSNGGKHLFLSGETTKERHIQLLVRGKLLERLTFMGEILLIEIVCWLGDLVCGQTEQSFVPKHIFFFFLNVMSQLI